MSELVQWIKFNYPGLFLPLAVSAAIYFIFKHANNRYPLIRDITLEWLLDEGDRSITNVVSNSINLYYGERIFSFKSIRRVVGTSIVSFVLILVIVLSTYDVGRDLFFSSFSWDLQYGILGYALMMSFLIISAIVVNVPIDLISYVQTRLFMKLIARVDSVAIGVSLIIVDVIFSMMIPVILTILVLMLISIINSGQGFSLAMVVGALDYLFSSGVLWKDSFLLYYQDFFHLSAPSFQESSRSGPLQLTLALTTMLWSSVLVLFFMFSVVVKATIYYRKILQRAFDIHDHNFVLNNPITYVGEYASICLFVLLSIVSFVF